MKQMEVKIRKAEGESDRQIERKKLKGEKRKKFETANKRENRKGK
jgi:hypothetical protein